MKKITTTKKNGDVVEVEVKCEFVVFEASEEALEVAGKCITDLADKGIKLIEEGRKAIAEGKELIEKAKELIKEGGKEAKELAKVVRMEGEILIETGKELLTEGNKTIKVAAMEAKGVIREFFRCLGGTPSWLKRLFNPSLFELAGFDMRSKGVYVVSGGDDVLTIEITEDMTRDPDDPTAVIATADVVSFGGGEDEGGRLNDHMTSTTLLIPDGPGRVVFELSEASGRGEVTGGGIITFNGAPSAVLPESFAVTLELDVTQEKTGEISVVGTVTSSPAAL